MKNNIFIIFVLALMLSITNAAAVNVVATTIQASPDSSTAGSVTIVNTAQFSITGCAVSIEDWPVTGISYDSLNVSASNNRSCSFTIAIPKGVTPGTHTGTVNVSGYEGGTFASNTASLTVNVSTSPSLTISWINAPANIYQEQNKVVSYNLSNSGNVPASGNLFSTVSLLNLTSSVVSFSLNPGESTAGSVTIITGEATEIGTATVTVNATGASLFSRPFEILYPYCDTDTNLTSPLKIIDITNDEDIDGEKFKPLDTFDIDVKVENIDDDDSQKAVVSAVLVDSNGEVSDTDVETKMRIESGDKELITLTMVIPADIDAGDYYLYIKVVNDDDEDNCMQRVLAIEVTKSSREVVVDSLKPLNSSCGAAVTLTGNLINIGTEDEDKVKIEYSDDFGNTATSYVDNLDAGDGAPWTAKIQVPKNVTEGNYNLNFRLFYDYDEDDEDYSEDESFTYTFKVLAGACTPSITGQSILTEASTAIVGVESEVRVTISNTGTTQQTFNVSVSADWADIKSITPSSIALNGGESEEVIIKIKAKDTAVIGVNNLMVNVQHGGSTESKLVAVNVQRSSVSSDLIEQLKFQLKYNPTWVIIDSVLVIAIIAVVVLLLTGKKN